MKTLDEIKSRHEENMSLIDDALAIIKTLVEDDRKLLDSLDLDGGEEESEWRVL